MTYALIGFGIVLWYFLAWVSLVSDTEFWDDDTRLPPRFKFFVLLVSPLPPVCGVFIASYVRMLWFTTVAGSGRFMEWGGRTFFGKVS